MKKKLLSLLFITSLACIRETQTMADHPLVLFGSSFFAATTAATTNFLFRNHRIKGNIAAACIIAGLNHSIYKKQPKVVWAGYGIGAATGMSGRKIVDTIFKLFHYVVTQL